MISQNRTSKYGILWHPYFFRRSTTLAGNFSIANYRHGAQQRKTLKDGFFRRMPSCICNFWILTRKPSRKNLARLLDRFKNRNPHTTPTMRMS